MEFDIPLIFSYLAFFEKRQKIQFYGCFDYSFPTGRPRDSEIINSDILSKTILTNKDNGFEINYLLNGNLGDLKIEKFEEYFEWIISDLKPNIITFSDPRVYHYLKDTFNYHKYEISAIAGIKNISGFEKFITYNDIKIEDISKIVLHHDNTIDLTTTIQFVDYLNNKAISPRVLVTESCYYKCPYRIVHYNSLIEAYRKPNEEFVDYYQIDCISKRLLNPETLLDLSGFLLPEQLKAFSKQTGINAFKLSGRSKSSEWICNTAKAYINQKSPDNLYEIIVFTSPYLSNFKMNLNDLFYLNSRSFFEFATELFTIADRQKRNNFISEQASKLFINGDLVINDPNSVYDVKNGKIINCVEGEYLKLLLNKQNSRIISNSHCTCTV